MGGAVVIPVIMEILTDFLVRPVSDDGTTLLNISVSEHLGHKTNKQRRTALFLSIHL